MKRCFVLFALLGLASCTEKKTITEPGPVFSRYYVDFYVYHADGVSAGQPVAAAEVNYRDTLLAKFGQLVSGPDGKCARQEWPEAPGPMNLDVKGPIRAFVLPYSAEGRIVQCQPDPVHSLDGICTYPIGMVAVSGN